MTVLSPKQEELCQQSTGDFSDRKALFISCTLKRSPEPSHTEGLADRSMGIMRRQGVQVDLIYVIPPPADAGWIGEAGPRPFLPGSRLRGPDNDFTNRNTTFMTWNLLHLARMLKDAGGIPAHGNQCSARDAGCRFDFQDSEHR